ncbi:MAG: TolC family protein [Candidatus Cloacimonadia bacterium]
MRKKILLIIASWAVISTVQIFAADTLDIYKVIDLGLQNSYDLMTEKYSLRIARENLYSSYLNFLPQINYNISRAEAANETEKSGNITVSESFSSSAERYFNVKNNLSSLKQNEIQLELSKRELIYQITQYYLNVLAAEELLTVTKLDLAIAKQALEETKILHSHGKASDLDLQMATVSVERARIDSLQRENTLEKNKMDLCFLINIDYDPEYIFTDLSYEFLSPEDFSFTESKNLRISSSAENLKQIKTSYTQTKLDFLPALSFSLSKSLEWKEKNIFDFDDTASPLRYTLSLSYPLLNPLTNIPSTQSSKYRLRQAELQFDQTREEEKQNFQFALTNFNQGKMSLNLAERQQQLEELNLNLVSEQYRLGQVSLTDLENARKSLLQSQVDYIQEYYNLILLQEELNLITNTKMLSKYQ